MRLIVAWFMVTVVVACNDGAAPPTETATASPPADLTIDSVVTIGGAMAEGASAFGLLRDVALLSSPARVALADWDSQEIRVFDLDGRHLQSFGRKGEGPGEHMGLSSIGGLPSGAVVGWDANLSRFTIHGTSGRAVARFDRTRFTDRQILLLGAAPDSSVYLGLPVFEGSLRGRPDGPLTDTVATVRVSWAQDRVDTISLSAAPTVHLIQGESMWSTEMPILGSRHHLAWAGDRVVSGRGDESTLSISLVGGGRTTAVLPFSPAPIDAPAVATERARRREAAPRLQIPGQDLVTPFLEMIDGLPPAPAPPVFDDIVGGNDGFFWVRRYVTASDTLAEWVGFDSDAVVLGRIDLPIDEPIVSAGDGLVVTRGRDDLGASFVRLLRLGSER